MYINFIVSRIGWCASILFKVMTAAFCFTAMSPSVYADSPRHKLVDAEIVRQLEKTPVRLVIYIPQSGIVGEEISQCTEYRCNNLVFEIGRQLAQNSEDKVLRESLGDLNFDLLLLTAIQSGLNKSMIPRVDSSNINKSSTFRGMERDEKIYPSDMLLVVINYYISKNRRELIVEAKAGLWPRRSEMLALRNARYPSAAGQAESFDPETALYLNMFRISVALLEPGADKEAVAIWSANGAVRAKAVAAEEAVILARLLAKDLGEVRMDAEAGKANAGNLDFNLEGKRVIVDRLREGSIWARASR